MIKSSYEVEVLVNGKPLKEYSHKKKVYIEGRKDTVFSLRLTNIASYRMLFVPTIDGLSVIDGKEASFLSPGYIIKPWTTVVVDGWRMSDEEVALFFFSSPDQSYGKRTGKGKNLGIIGMAVFDQKKQGDIKTIVTHTKSYPDWTFINAGTPYNMSSTENYSCSAIGLGDNMNFSSCSTPSLGTGWGKPKQSNVTSVLFDREDEPEEVFEMFYNTKKELQKLGISFDKNPVYISKAFPNEKRYCEPPKD